MAPRRRACYPGSFDPPSIAHRAVAEAVRRQRDVDIVDLVVSRVALGKETVSVPTLDDRLAVLAEVTAEHPWLDVVVTDHQLLVDIARGYDVLVMGADKWAQVHDPVFYDGPSARDAAVAALPEVAVVPRPPHPTPAELALHLDPALATVSSTRARAGETHLMLPAARRFDQATGAWTDPARYLARRR